MSAASDNQDLQKAYALHQRGKLDEAASLYRDLLRRNPNNFQALHLLGLVEAGLGNLSLASNLMARSLSAVPPNVQFIENYASVLFQMADYKTALEVSQEGIALDGRNVGLAYLSAISLLKLNRFDEALVQFEKVLSVQPGNAAAHNERGSVLAALDRHEEALRSVEKALTLAPKQPEVLLNLGNLYAKLKRYDDAVGVYGKAVDARPSLIDAWLGLGNVHRALKHFERAVAAYDKAQALDPNAAAVWLGRGNVYYEQRRYRDAISAYDRALTVKSSLVEAWLGRGNASLCLYRLDDATAALDEAIRLKPDFADAWLGRANVLQEQKRYDEFSVPAKRHLNSTQIPLRRGVAVVSISSRRSGFVRPLPLLTRRSQSSPTCRKQFRLASLRPTFLIKRVSRNNRRRAKFGGRISARLSLQSRR